jgi:hypothetical protein
MRDTHPDKNLFNLGLAISGATLAPGPRRTAQAIADFCSAAGASVSRQAISHIEQRALRKLRLNPVLKELVKDFLNE